jgi:hypothetical protein
MQRARRAALGAVLVVLGGLVLSGCRSQPGVAYYLGDSTVSESRIDQLAHGAKAGVDEFNQRNAGPLSEQAPVPGGDEIVAALVTRDVAKRLAGEMGVQPMTDQREPQSQGPKSEFSGIQDETIAYLNGIADAMVTSAQNGNQQLPVPGDDDVRDAFDRATAARVVDPSRFNDFKQAILGQRNYVVLLDLRAKMMAAAGRYRIRINPRYRPADFPLKYEQDQAGRSFVLIGLPMSSVGSHG